MAAALADADLSASLDPAFTGSRPSMVTLSRLGESEEQWRRFEQVALASPYQRYDWIQAYAGTVEHGGDILVASVRSAGRLVAMMALRRRRKAGLRLACPVGGKHANFNQVLIDADFLAGARPNEMHGLIAAIGCTVGADVVALPGSPMVWSGYASPLAVRSIASASDAYGLTLGPDPETVQARVSSSHARKKLRSKERGLAKIGPFVVERANSAREVESVLDVFFEQKRRRFDTLGIDDPFAAPEAQAFVRAASLSGLEAGSPAIELYALRMEERVVAVLGGAADAHRFSGMFISFEPDAPEARFSPGEILVSHAIADQCRRGRSAFDLGTGEARYKRTFCDETISLVDVIVPITLAGRLGCAAFTPALKAKRRLKQSPAFMSTLGMLRRLKAGAVER